MRLSLGNRLAVVFFAIILLAIGGLYLYVAPGLQSRLMGEKLSALAATAQSHSDPLRRSLGSDTSLPRLRQIVARTAVAAGNRVTLVSVNQVLGAPQLAVVADAGAAAGAGGAGEAAGA